MLTSPSKLSAQLQTPDRLTIDDLHLLLSCSDPEVLEVLRSQARSLAQARFGCGIYVRGLIEISNYCSNDCYYCGIRRGNNHVQRYRLSRQEILDSCALGYRQGFRTFVLQGGEDPYWRSDRLVKLVATIRHDYPDCALTLSLGEMEPDEYQALYDAGANRYLLRHETHAPEHYAQLHPASMSLEHRLGCLDTLKRIGFQTGTGVMIGSPYQTLEHLAEDLDYIRRLQPEMIGVGPFIPHGDTPFGGHAAGDLALTLRFLALSRILCPTALIPATTAVATLAPEGRREAILAGCNVVMPNLSPLAHRADYALYKNKAALGAESAEGIRLLSEQLARFGYHIDWDRGDAPHDASHMYKHTRP